MGKMVKVTIDGVEVEAEEGTTIYEAAKKIGINIPVFCYHPEIKEKIGACRICLVEVEGLRDPVPSCSTPVRDGMKIRTSTPQIREIRRFVLELLKSIHRSDCLHCIRNQTCDFMRMSYEYGLYERVIFDVRPREVEKDESSPAVIRDPEKCIYCGRCVSACSVWQTVYALGYSKRGKNLFIGPAFNMPLAETPCVQCGQCIMVCPVGAIYERDETEKVWKLIDDPETIVVVQTAPAVRVALGEEFGLAAGEIVTGKMVAALKRLGFDYVFDTQFGADLTIVEECEEFIEKINKGEGLPLFTSCCPAWVEFLRKFYPELLSHLSSAKSPQAMLGSMVKTYFAQKLEVSPEKIKVVSIMPCTAKKMEAGWSEHLIEVNGKNYRSVDVVLTTREVSRMIKQVGMDIRRLPEETFDAPFGVSTGAGAIFGGTGGVMEAALRYAYEKFTGKELKKVEFEQIRGLDWTRIAEIELNGKKLKVAVAHTLGAARKVIEMWKSGELADLAFMEVMACPGGCLGGGGQPIPTDMSIRKARIESIWKEDRTMTLRKSQENPYVMRLYNEFLKEPGSDLAKKYLHVHFTPSALYPSLKRRG